MAGGMGMTWGSGEEEEDQGLLGDCAGRNGPRAVPEAPCDMPCGVRL